MRKFLISIILMAMALYLLPSIIYADTTDECDRVGALINSASVTIDRAGPIIIRSGNRPAINMLNEAVDELHAAQRAYRNDLCREAYHHAQAALSLIRGALRLVNRATAF